MDDDEIKNKRINDFDKEIEDIKERQGNQFNPGHYIGTGRVPRPLAKMKRQPFLMIVIGILGIVPVFFVLSSSGTILGIVLPMVIAAFVPLVFLYGGIRRILEIKKKK